MESIATDAARASRAFALAHKPGTNIGLPARNIEAYPITRWRAVKPMALDVLRLIEKLLTKDEARPKAVNSAQGAVAFTTLPTPA